MSDSERLDQLARASRRSALVGALGLVVFLGSLVFGSVYLNSVSEKLQARQARLDTLQEELVLTELQIAEQREDVDSLRSLKENLFNELAAIDRARATRTVQTVVDSMKATRQTPRVWIHIAREEQRPAAREVQQLLETAGVSVQGIERVDRAPRTSQLRIFRDAERTGARRIQQLLETEGYRFSLENLTPTYSKKDLSWLRPGHFELWFGTSSPSTASATS